MSDEVLNIAKNYLNTKEISINASFFISNPLETSENEKYKNAQYFHWDNDFTKFVKLYIYLNDVNYDNGPHIFIPETHKLKSKTINFVDSIRILISKTTTLNQKYLLVMQVLCFL